MKNHHMISFGAIFTALVFGETAMAQTIWVPGGATSGVGDNTANSNIGIATNAPFAKLDVAGRVNLGTGTAQNAFLSADTQLQILSDGGAAAQLTFWQSGVAGSHIGHKANDANLYLTNTYDGSALGTAARSVAITNTGNVGIGTITPGAPLHVRGDTLYIGTIRADGPSGGYSSFGLYEDGIYQASLYWHAASEAATFYGPDKWVFESGNVGIGTFDPSHKLAVNGTIRAKEVIVDSGWADHVFADGYQLVPLDEVEAHIRARRHLPGIPSAAEVAEQGISVGEMQAKLLEKIEELTLHVIEQGKRIQRLESENLRLRSPGNARHSMR